MQENRKDQEVFEKLPLGKAFITLTIPPIITQIVMIIYNFADTFFLGMTNNENMVAALSVSMPIYIIMTAIANLFGVGGSSTIARYLGLNKVDKARKAFVIAFYSSILTALIYTLVIIVFQDSLISIIGGNSDSFAYIKKYMFWTMIIGAVPTVMNALCGHLVRSIGASKEASFGMILGAALNIVLDPLFMFVILPKGNEVTGAAVATLISNTVSCIYFFIYIYKHRDNRIFSYDIQEYTFKGKIFNSIITIGIPAALATTMAMVSNIFANKLLESAGNSAVSGLGIAKKVNTLAFNLCLGITQGVLPLIAYNYASKNFKRMKDAIKLMFGCVLSFSIICLVLFKVFTPGFISFFIQNDSVIDYGVISLDVIAWAVPFCGISYSVNTIFQATKHRTFSFILSILRKGLFDIPLMFILKSKMGVNGVLYATPIAEVAAIFVAISFFIVFIRKIKKEEKSIIIEYN